VNNSKIRDIRKEVLSDNWYTLFRYTYEYQKEDGEWEDQVREVYDRGNGAAILLYNQKKGTIILTKQFRMPTYVNGNPSGMMIEVCAGLLDGAHPEDCIKKEVEEETGYQIDHVKKVFESYMSPGAVTEILHFFIGEYQEQMKVSDGGGVEYETENIEVLEVLFDTALNMITNGKIKDAKTIMLLQYARLNNII
jgi:nudix-type nucleoside diphosphatase (YffH/AdpP family)